MIYDHKSEEIFARIDAAERAWFARFFGEEIARGIPVAILQREDRVDLEWPDPTDGSRRREVAHPRDLGWPTDIADLRPIIGPVAGDPISLPEGDLVVRAHLRDSTGSLSRFAATRIAGVWSEWEKSHRRPSRRTVLRAADAKTTGHPVADAIAAARASRDRHLSRTRAAAVAAAEYVIGCSAADETENEAEVQDWILLRRHDWPGRTIGHQHLAMIDLVCRADARGVGGGCGLGGPGCATDRISAFAACGTGRRLAHDGEAWCAAIAAAASAASTFLDEDSRREVRDAPLWRELTVAAIDLLFGDLIPPRDLEFFAVYGLHRIEESDDAAERDAWTDVLGLLRAEADHCGIARVDALLERYAVKPRRWAEVAWWRPMLRAGGSS